MGQLRMFHRPSSLHLTLTSTLTRPAPTHPFLALGLDLSLRGGRGLRKGGTKGRDWEKSADWGRGGCWGLAPGVVRVRAAAARLGFSESQIPRRRLGAGVVTAS